MSYSIIVAEPQRTKTKLKRYAQRLETLWPTVWKEVTESVAAAEMEWFASEGRSGAAGWAQLSPKYAAEKASGPYGGEPLLVATGDLRDSVTNPGELVMEVAYGPSEGEIVLGSHDPKAEWHEEGTDKMPARPVFIPGTRVWEIVREAVKHNTAWEL